MKNNEKNLEKLIKNYKKSVEKINIYWNLRNFYSRISYLKNLKD